VKRKRYLFTLLVVFSTQAFFIPNSANAGLNCSDVRSEVLKLEKYVINEQAYWVGHEGEKIKGTLELAFQKSERNQYLKKLGKLQYNNQSCFTRSQYDQILSKHYWTAPFTFNLGSMNSAFGLDCKDNPTAMKGIDLGKYAPKGYKRGITCDIPLYLYVDMKNNLYGRSIYTY